jgi:hypothetical protein
VLDQLEKEGNDRFAVGDIVRYLVEKTGIGTSPPAIRYALQIERSAANKNVQGYKLMQKGRDQLQAIKQQEAVVFIESGKPFTAKHVELKSLFSSFTGTVCITDPYLDLNTLDVLFKVMDKNTETKILTNKVIDRPKGVFVRQLAELRQEGYRIEVGVYLNSTLHDRYIMDDNSFWLSGNSLNHLGKRESFIVKLDEDIRQSMIATFHHRWKVAAQV